MVAKHFVLWTDATRTHLATRSAHRKGESDWRYDDPRSVPPLLVARHGWEDWQTPVNGPFPAFSADKADDIVTWLRRQGYTVQRLDDTLEAPAGLPLSPSRRSTGAVEVPGGYSLGRRDDGRLDVRCPSCHDFAVVDDYESASYTITRHTWAAHRGYSGGAWEPKYGPLRRTSPDQVFVHHQGPWLEGEVTLLAAELLVRRLDLLVRTFDLAAAHPGLFVRPPVRRPIRPHHLEEQQAALRLAVADLFEGRTYLPVLWRRTRDTVNHCCLPRGRRMVGGCPCPVGRPATEAPSTCPTAVRGVKPRSCDGRVARGVGRATDIRAGAVLIGGPHFQR